MELVLKNQQVLNTLKNIRTTNKNYVAEKEQEILQYSRSQSPIATLVMCCDSRAHSTSFTYDPENNFFIVRNIGNQYILNQGCVEFGVRVLKTSLLIFMGHTQCGAIKASMGDYGNLHSSIIREIDHLALSIKRSELGGDETQKWKNAVINNVNQQVALALKDFEDLRENKELVVIGMILDIDNSLNNGHGNISVINVNGNTNPDDLKQYPLVADFFIQ